MYSAVSGIAYRAIFGLKAAAVVAVAFFVSVMAVCWGICGWKVFRD